MGQTASTARMETRNQDGSVIREVAAPMRAPVEALAELRVNALRVADPCRPV